MRVSDCPELEDPTNHLVPADNEFDDKEMEELQKKLSEGAIFHVAGRIARKVRTT